MGAHLAIAMLPTPSGRRWIIIRLPPTISPFILKTTGSCLTDGQRLVAKTESCSWQTSSKAAIVLSQSASGTSSMVIGAMLIGRADDTRAAASPTNWSATSDISGPPVRSMAGVLPCQGVQNPFTTRENARDGYRALAASAERPPDRR